MGNGMNKVGFEFILRSGVIVSGCFVVKKKKKTLQNVARRVPHLLDVNQSRHIFCSVPQ